MQSYRDLLAWQKSRALIKELYQVTATLPKSEQFGLISQMRRAAVSISSNLAEGSSRQSTREFIRFINISYGSLMELESQMIVSQDLDYIDTETANSLLEKTSEIGRMLNGLRNSLNKKLNSELRTLDSENA